MSVQWWLHTNSSRSKEQVIGFMRLLQGANESSEFKSEDLVEFRGHALARVYVPRRGSALSNTQSYGFVETLCVVFNKVRGSNSENIKDTIYEVAYRFADWDQFAELWFCENEVGIFKRGMDGFVVNIHMHDTPSLKRLLPTKFELAVEPEAMLRVAEQSDQPKSR